MKHSRYPLSSSSQQLIQSLQTIGKRIQKSAGMDQDSTATEQLADWLSRQNWSELLTDRYHVEQRFSSDGKAVSLRLRSSIVDLTFTDESGTLLEELASL